MTMMSTTMLIAASLVGIHGRWSAKKVRVSSRLSPAKGRLKANQNSAERDQVRRAGAEVAVLEDEPGDRRGEHDHQRRRRDQQQVDLAHPVAERAAHLAGVARGRPCRLRVGNSTVATATLNTPWGSM